MQSINNFNCDIWTQQTRQTLRLGEKLQATNAINTRENIPGSSRPGRVPKLEIVAGDPLIDITIAGDVEKNPVGWVFITFMFKFIAKSAWDERFKELASLRVASREIKLITAQVREIRSANESSILHSWRTIYTQAEMGGCYIRFYVKAWLDFFQQGVLREAEASGLDVSANPSDAIDWKISRTQPVNNPGPHDTGSTNTDFV